MNTAWRLIDVHEYSKGSTPFLAQKCNYKMNFICLNLRQWQKEVGHHAPGLNESELQLSWVESASYFFFFCTVDH